MKLVKDFIESRIIYYWIDDDSIRISPYIASVNLAAEWRKVHHQEQYASFERRRSHVDRRRYLHKRHQRADGPTLQAQVNSLSSGRRTTDRTIKVDIDRAKLKLLKLAQKVSEASEMDADPMENLRSTNA